MTEQTINLKQNPRDALAQCICTIAGIEPIDSLDGSQNWWMFLDIAAKVVDDLQSRGFLKERALEPKP